MSWLPADGASTRMRRSDVDPRVERTRAHVLGVTRDVLASGRGETLTFSRLAEEARVSRKTLYVHWGSVEQLLRDAVLIERREPPRYTGASLYEDLLVFLTSVRDGIRQPVTRAALGSLMSRGTSQMSAIDALRSMTDIRMNQLAEGIGEVTEAHYAQLVGPIFFMEFMAGSSATDELLQSIAAHGAALVTQAATSPR